ncbi:MAG: TIGR00269 family protein [Candidatus Nanoarchaeia archaeon]|nr:TIGR00269 family protein [Candidatus Nanoarchaeia archaeon]
MKTLSEIEETVKQTIEKYKLADKKDKIIVACSGGKDSTTCLYILNKLRYNVEAMTINLGIGKYSDDNTNNISKFCETIGVKLHILDMKEHYGGSICYLRSGIQSKVNLSNCTICGVIKRWMLNKESRRLKADRLATGHNLDDEVENVLMNFMNGNPELSINLGPKTGILKDKKFVERIKPLYFCTNAEIKEYSEKHTFPVIYEPCPCSAGTYRREIRKHIGELSAKYPEIKQNLVENFLRILPVIQKKYMYNRELRYCELCGEPSNRQICKRCEFLGIFKS